MWFLRRLVPVVRTPIRNLCTLHRPTFSPTSALAEQYTFADRMFQTNQGPSYPAHQFIISGTSAPTATSSLFASENPIQDNLAGCTAALTTTVPMIDPTGSESASAKEYPCFDHPTLTDLLDAKSFKLAVLRPVRR